MDKYTAAEEGFKRGYEKGKPKWIPVGERLPEKYGEYIVTVQEETGELYSDYADYDPYQQRWRTGLFLGVRDKVTHWMPLPEPPDLSTGGLNG